MGETPSASVVQRASAFARRRPLLADAALSAILLVPSVLVSVGEGGIEPRGRLFGAALVLVLVLRRRLPTLVFAAIAAIAAVQWLLDVRTVGDVALLVALHTVASSRSRRETLAAFAVVEAGVVLACLRWAPGLDATIRGLIGLSGLAVAAAVMGIAQSNRRALVATLEDRAERLEHERDQQGRLSAAAERARIAREMHDIVAHNVSVMIALADGAGYALENDPGGARIAMETASRTGRQALGEMRRLLGVLRDDAPGSGGLAPQPDLGRLDQLLHQVRSAGLPVGFHAAGRPHDALPAGLQLAIYRIVQEALTNTLKHAGPGTSAQVNVAYLSDRIELEIVDDGRVAREPVDPAGGGLRGMRERAAVYHGRLQAGPAEHTGWHVRLTVPLGSPLLPA